VEPILLRRFGGVSPISSSVKCTVRRSSD